MQHEFSDNYVERSLPVADKGSFVKPIPKEEHDNLRPSEVSEKIWSHLLLCGHITAAAAVSEPHIGTSDADILKPSTTPVTFKAQAALTALSENNPEEENNKISFGTTAMTEEQPGAGQEGSYVRTSEMDTGENQEKQTGSLVPLNGRYRNYPRRKATRKNHEFMICSTQYRFGVYALACVLLLCWISSIVPVSEGFGGVQLAAEQKAVQCFTCMDGERCPKLMTIYDRDDNHVYQRTLNEEIPQCRGISQPTPKGCVVCRDQHNITIICSNDVGRMEVEDSDGKTIKISHSVCAWPHTRSRYGLISIAFFVIVVVALVIYSKTTK